MSIDHEVQALQRIANFRSTPAPSKRRLIALRTDNNPRVSPGHVVTFGYGHVVNFDFDFTRYRISFGPFSHREFSTLVDYLQRLVRKYTYSFDVWDCDYNGIDAWGKSCYTTVELLTTIP